MPNRSRAVDEEAMLDALREGESRSRVAVRFEVGYLRVKALAEAYGIRAVQGRGPGRGTRPEESGRVDGEALRRLYRRFVCGPRPAGLEGRARWR